MATTNSQRVQKSRNFRKFSKRFFQQSKNNVVSLSIHKEVASVEQQNPSTPPITKSSNIRVDQDDLLLPDNVGGLNNDFDYIMDQKEEQQQELYKDATISIESAITLILYILVKFNIPTSQVETFLNLLGLLLPKENNLPSSKSKLFKEFKNFGFMKKVYYCDTCNDSLAGDACIHNHSPKFFLYHSLNEQLQKRINEDKSFANNFNYYRTREKKEGIISDVFDGEYFKETVSVNNGLYVQLNWDGVSPFKSSVHSIWPIYCVILNLPPELRYKPENMFMVGVWFGKSKPKTDVFLNHFTKDFKQLETEGLIIANEQDTTTWFGYLFNTVCDLPAHACLYKMNMANGMCSCGFCLHSGISKLRRWIFPVDNRFSFEQRNENSCKLAANVSSEENVVDGLKGRTPLFNLNTFSWTKSQTPDAMHQISGIFRCLVKCWTKSGSKSRIEKAQWDRFNIVLKQQKLISLFKRRARSLNDYKYFKAHESLVFFLYLTPLTKDYFPQKIYDHLELLTKALNILFSANISKLDLLTAEDYLIKFLHDFDDVYGDEYLTLNFHYLIHLADMVRNHGPLWTMTCFPFESYNKIFTSFIHGTNNVEMYASESFNLTKELKYRIANETFLPLLEIVDKKNVSC